MRSNVRIASYQIERLGCDAVVGKQLEGVRPELGWHLNRFRLDTNKKKLDKYALKGEPY